MIRLIDDIDLYGDVSDFISPICTACIHLRVTAENTCDAFPAGIPDEIWSGEDDHTKPFPGDKGIMFEQNPKQPRRAGE